MKHVCKLYFFRGFVVANGSLQRLPKKSAKTAEKHEGVGCFDRVSNGRAFDQPPRWSRGKWFERWRNGRSRLVPIGVGIVIAMHMVSRTIKRNSHSAVQEGEGEEWDFRVRFNRATGERGGSESYYESNSRVPLASRNLLAGSLAASRFRFLSIFSRISQPPTLYSLRSCVRHSFTRTMRRML